MAYMRTAVRRRYEMSETAGTVLRASRLRTELAS
jgi:hypothetical protein